MMKLVARLVPFVVVGVCECSASTHPGGFDDPGAGGKGSSTSPNGQGGDVSLSGSGGSTGAGCDPTQGDCSGTHSCDDNLDLASLDPMDGARAIGLCKIAGATDWGVVSADYVTADGQAL